MPSTLDPAVREVHHFHGCEACGNIWSHDPPSEDISREDFDKMHSCELCGSQENCDIAAASRDEAEEMVTKGYITIKGKRYYAADPYAKLLDKLMGGML
jgi:hypothetical protein